MYHWTHWRVTSAGGNSLSLLQLSTDSRCLLCLYHGIALHCKLSNLCSYVERYVETSATQRVGDFAAGRQLTGEPAQPKTSCRLTATRCLLAFAPKRNFVYLSDFERVHCM